MPFPIIIEPAANQDIRDASIWLEEQRNGLSEYFRNGLDDAFDRIASNPYAYSVIERRTRPIRLKNLNYVVSYIVFESKVHITAVLHGHRDPREWKKRF